MRSAILATAFAALFAAAPAYAQSPAPSTPDNNVTRTDDGAPPEAPYVNEEGGQPSEFDPSLPTTNDGIVIDDGSTGAGSGESGEDSDLRPPPEGSPPRN